MKLNMVNKSFVCVFGAIFVNASLFSASVGIGGRNVLEDSANIGVVQETDAQSVQEGFSKERFIYSLQEALENGTIQDALSLFDSIPQEESDDFDLQFLKAALLVSATEYNSAKTICNNLLTREPENTDVIELAATIAKAQGNTAERNKQLKVLLGLDAYNPAANIALAEDAFSKKNYKQSRQYYQKALVREPKNQDALFGVGQTSYYLEDDKRATSTFKQILKDDPYYAPAYSYLGKLAAADNEFKVASDYIKKAIALEPDNYDYVMDYGMYERDLGHYAEAEKAWTKAIQIQPDYFLAYAYRAGLLDEQDRFSDALRDYNMVVKLKPEYYYAYESIGVLAIHEKKWKTAREAFQKCFSYNANNISYPLMITYCYYMEGNSAMAKSFSDSVLRKLDRSSIDYAMLRVYHDLAGEMPLPQKISHLSSRNQQGKMYFYLGLLYDMIGGSEASREYFTKVVAMNSPMFFEYRIAEWSVGKVNVN